MNPRMPVRDVMNTGVLTFRDDGTVAELAAYLMDKEISGVPVVDAKGRLVGVVSVTDIVEQRTREHETTDVEELRRASQHANNVLVRDIMTPTVFTVPDDTAVAEVARTMIAGRIHRLFVTRGGNVVGIVTTLDLLKLVAHEAA